MLFYLSLSLWLGGGGGASRVVGVGGGVDQYLTSQLTVPSVFKCCCEDMSGIVSDEEIFAQFKEESRKHYRRVGLQFREYLPEFVLCIGGGVWGLYSHITVGGGGVQCSTLSPEGEKVTYFIALG